MKKRPALNQLVYIPKTLSQGWGALRITSKLSLAIGLLLFMLLMQTAIAFVALTITWDSNSTILDASETQRLVMIMSRNWETVRRLQQSFFIQSPLIGANQAYQLYALPASGKISEVVQGGATLKRRGYSLETNGHSEELDPTLALILSNISQYSTTFEDATNLEITLNSTGTGLHFQLQRKAELLAATLKADRQLNDVLVLFYEMRFYEERYLATSQITSMSTTIDIASELQLEIEESAMQADNKDSALALLKEYQNIANEIYRIEIQIQDKLNLLNSLGETIDPNLIELMVSAEADVNRARLQIEQTRRVTLIMLISAMIIGLLFTVFIAFLFHNSVTRMIVNLIRVAGQYQQGDLGARSPITSSDELGQLARTFNQMAETIQRRMTEIEKLQVDLREQAIRDALTGLFNRRYFDETLTMDFWRADRDGTPITLVMLDIDHFKLVNDRFGHAVGDKILLELATILKSQSRSGDITCRYGGEEFVTLLIGASLADGVRRADEWRRNFSKVKVQSQGASCSATLSAGVVERRHHERPSELLARADAQMYKAKNTGRNCVSASDPDRS